MRAKVRVCYAEVTMADHARIMALAWERGVPLASLVREAVSEFLEGLDLPPLEASPRPKRPRKADCNECG